MLMSEHIAEIIEALLSDGNGVTELQRNELAEQIGCVPSQINYVITSRFTPARGYIVESRRGGGGYIRIKKIELDKVSYVMHLVNAIGDELDYRSSVAIIENLCGEGIITKREAEMLKVILTDRALYDVPSFARNIVRASLLKNAMLGLLNCEQN